MPGARAIVRGITIIYWSLLVAGTHLPPLRLPRTGVSDKGAHFATFFILGFLVYWSLRFTRHAPLRVLAMTLLVVLIYGAIDEITQPLVGRICSAQDWLADAAGTVVGATLAFAIDRLIAWRAARR